MNDIEERVQEIIAQFGDLTRGAEPQEFKRTVQNFLENGPGMLEQRRQTLFKHIRDWDTQYKDFLTKPN